MTDAFDHRPEATASVFALFESLAPADPPRSIYSSLAETAVESTTVWRFTPRPSPYARTDAELAAIFGAQAPPTSVAPQVAYSDRPTVAQLYRELLDDAWQPIKRRAEELTARQRELRRQAEDDCA